MMVDNSKPLINSKEIWAVKINDLVAAMRLPLLYSLVVFCLL